MPVEEADLEAAGGQQGNPRSSPEQQTIMSAATYSQTELTGAATMSAATYSFPVVILGGGFAGAYCARALSAGLGQAAADAVALVADQNVMLFHPMLAEVSGSSISPLHVVNPLRRFCRDASIFRGAVEKSTWRRTPCASRPGPMFPRPP
jgi:hypothetical protein